MLQRPRLTTRSTIYCGILISAGLVSAGLTPAHATDPTGDWKVEDGVAAIRVAECNGSMWGAVAWEKTPGGLDKNNPDVSKRNRPTLGMPILIDMKKNAAGNTWAGQVYNAKDGKFYKSTIKLGNTPDELEIQGCVLGFLCGGETWTRVGPPIPSSPSNLVASSSNAMTKGAPKGATAMTSAKSGPATAKLPPKGAQKNSGTTVATATEPADTVGDICLLPDIARLPH
jgi:uncharacterized protein (DUF2147 family)